MHITNHIKSFVLLIIAASSSLFSFSQTFTSLASNPPGTHSYGGVLEHHATNSVYVFGGWFNWAYTKQVQQYDIGSDTWLPPVATPSNMKSCFGYYFNINDRMFYGGGMDGGYQCSNNTWEYIPPSTFNPVDDFPLSAAPNGSSYGFSFVIGNYGYVGEGFGATLAAINKFVRFDPSAASGSQWTVMSPYPGMGDYFMVSASLNGFGYAGLGSSISAVLQNDFYKYDPLTGAGGTWTAMTPFPGAARDGAMMMTICNKLILVGGVSGATYHDDIWEFDPSAGATGAWTLLGNYNQIQGAAGGRGWAAGVAYGDSLFFGMGYGATGQENSDWNLLRFVTDISSQFTVSDSVLCEGDQVTFTDQSTDTPRYWTWDFPGGSPTGSTTQNPAVTYNTSGVYDVTLIVENVCIDTLVKPNYITVSVPPVITVMNDTTICSGQSATLTAVPSISGGTYSWAPGGQTTQTITISPSSTTTYTVTYTPASGCPNVGTATVSVNPPPTVSVAASNNAFCNGGSTTITATPSISGGNYSWAPGGQTTPSITVSPTTTTTYTVTYSDPCGSGNNATATVTITVYQVPDVAFTVDNTSGCTPVCVNFSDATTTNGSTIASWSWDFNDGTAGTQNPSHCFYTPGQYTVSLKVITTDGCSDSASTANMITVNDLPVASFNSPVSASISEAEISFTDNSTGANSWAWDFGDIISADNSSSDKNPTHRYSEVGTYCINLIVGNASNCYDTTENCLVIDAEFALYIPNAFTPNDDNLNDEFYPKGDNITDFNMSIYDRWGNVLFTTDNISKHWNGKVKGGAEIAQQDVYVYVINIKDNKDQAHKYIGSVSLVK